MDKTDTISSREAAELLGIKRATLYTYVSRGWLRPFPDARDPRRRLYLRSEVMKLHQRQRARAGHGAVAADALRWGEPVLETAVSRIDPTRGPEYRGHLVAELTLSFEATADLLWDVEETVEWPIPPDSATGSTSLDALVLRLAQEVLNDPLRRALRGEPELALARRLTSLAASQLGGQPYRGKLASCFVAAKAPSAHVDAVDRALVIVADHELNASTFAARIVASTGADLYSSVAAALGALSGPRHGGMSLRVSDLFDQLLAASDPAEAMARRLSSSELIPGFGHRLYPAGDPRGRWLLALADAHDSPDDPVMPRVHETIAAIRSLGYPPPTLDVGLVALSRVLGLGRDGGQRLFAAGRMAGWIAHAREQRRRPELLRPRARYARSSP